MIRLSYGYEFNRLNVIKDNKILLLSLCLGYTFSSLALPRFLPGAAQWTENLQTLAEHRGEIWQLLLTFTSYILYRLIP